MTRIRGAVQALASDSREAEAKQGEGGWKGGEEVDAGGLSKVGKRCERAGVDGGSDAGAALEERR